ncbi:MAG: hypothetical protein K6G50_13310, partial [bacterium]|nr:hypothetical protein [bacterium]
MLFSNENGFYYLIQNMDTAMPDFFMTGNIPYLTQKETINSLLFIVALILATALLYNKLVRLAYKKQWRPFKLLLIRIFIFIAFFAVLELSLSLPYFRPERDFIPDPITFWSASLKKVPTEMKKRVPNTQYRPRIQGIFDTSFSQVKAPNTYRILFMGDSQSISSGSKQYVGFVSYPKKTGIIINEEGLVSADGRKVETINGGMSGFSSWQGRLFLDNKLINLEPDLIIEAFGYHDSNLAYSYDKEIISADPRIWKFRKFLYS